MKISEQELRRISGFAKLKGVCDQAVRDSYDWVWVDTCCIDKSSSAGLQEVINSMFAWYRNSNICYFYPVEVLKGLAWDRDSGSNDSFEFPDFASFAHPNSHGHDSDTGDATDAGDIRNSVCSGYCNFRNSRWWPRGWTLRRLFKSSFVSVLLTSGRIIACSKLVEFYATDWTKLGTKIRHRQKIHEITGIRSNAL